jgi:hypothetical protein
MVRRTRSELDGSRPVKIVVTGPFASGKTTMIKTISEISILGTDRNITDQTSSVKQRTTVAMDFGRISFGSDALFLFGTPGQPRFEVMWEILSDGMIGYILLVNAGEERSIEEAAHIIDAFRAYADVPCVVGVTHVDESPQGEQDAVATVRRALELPEGVLVTACDPRQREDVKALMLQVLLEVKDRLEAAEALSQRT